MLPIFSCDNLRILTQLSYISYIWAISLIKNGKIMRYQYNYSYLEKWMKSNGNITDREILRAIGSSSNQSLGLWRRMKAPMPTISMLRFCNTFNVPLSAFIVDLDDENNKVMRGEDDKLVPEDGYIAGDAKRGVGHRALRDPLDVESIPSVVPGLRPVPEETPPPLDAPKTEDSGAENVESTPPKASPDTANCDGRRLEHDTTIINKLLDIIADQQKTISDQHHQIVDLTQKVLHLQNNGTETSAGIYMVADPIHK